MGKTEIIRLKPVFKQMIWGGSRMRKVFGYDIPGDDTGECWAISAHKNGDCIVSTGDYKGMTLSSLWEEHQELFGGSAEQIRKRDGIREDTTMPVFPLLTKIIDARNDLSIQVHPDDEYALKNENGSLGKTECWYILDCKPEGTIVIGHNAKSRDELCEMIDNGRWSELIREIPVKKGDFFQIEPGTIHAIKGGTLLLETQQNSDITYRVYDYDRLQNGKKRELHVAQSKAVVKVPFDASATRETGEPLKGTIESTSLVVSRYYRVWKAVNTSKGELEVQYPFLLCSVIDGKGRIDGETVVKGEHFIIPSGYGKAVLEGEFEMIVSTI